ncbi:MAG: glutamate--cysteine ligase [Rickettsiales bacterium]
MQIMDVLDGLLQSRGEEIEHWLAARAQETPPFIYGSVDLRHSGTKIVPVDTNLFPGGFNNLSPAASKRASEKAKGFLSHRFPDAGKLLILAESHTRNLAYLENVACLQDILTEAGYEVEIGTLLADMQGPMELETSKGRTIVEHRLERDGNILRTQEGFVPDVVIVNNDFTAGAPEILKGCEQPIMPPVGMGWHRRRKRVHFAAYDALVRDFGEAFGIDHWLISAYFRNCGMVDFRAQSGFECVATNVDMVLNILRVKYAEYGIKEDPYVYVKADSGTYGMGVMTVRSGEEALALNKKARNKMDTIKEGYHNTEVVIQEGVPTIDKIDGFTAEPMIYVVDDAAVGGAFRVNEEKDAYGNLNSRGMRFYGMCDEGEDGLKTKQPVSHCNFGVYGLIARLATLAAAREEY